MADSDVLHATAGRWRSGGIACAGATEAELDAIERRLGVVLVADLRALYRKSNGMPPNTMDGDLIRFWSCAEFEDAAREVPAAFANAHRGVRHLCGLLSLGARLCIQS